MAEIAAPLITLLGNNSIAPEPKYSFQNKEKKGIQNVFGICY